VSAPGSGSGSRGAGGPGDHLARSQRKNVPIAYGGRGTDDKPLSRVVSTMLEKEFICQSTAEGTSPHGTEACHLGGCPAAEAPQVIHRAYRSGAVRGSQNHPQISRRRAAPGLLALSAPSDQIGAVPLRIWTGAGRRGVTRQSALSETGPTCLPGL
jgi:hypothetical protein